MEAIEDDCEAAFGVLLLLPPSEIFDGDGAVLLCPLEAGDDLAEFNADIDMAFFSPDNGIDGCPRGVR